MTASRVTFDGVPNEPIPWSEFSEALAPFLDLLGVDPKDVVSLHVSSTSVRAKVNVRTRRGRRVGESWAHISRRVDFPADEEG